MITLSGIAATALARGNQRRHVRVESWYDDTLVDDDVPVSAGTLEVDRGSNVPERLTLTVPRFDRGTNYTPVETDAPLSANGQKLRVQVGIGLAGGTVEWLQLGWFVITRSEPRGDQVDVEAAGLLWLVQEARLINPLQPTGTMVSAIRQIVEPALTVSVDAALTDRAIGTLNYDDDRLSALMTTLAAWPATADVTADGYLYVTTADDPSLSVLTLTDGVGGTVIQASGSSTRDGVYNAVVAQGQTSDGQVVRGVAFDYTGPKRAEGPFNPLPVPLYFDSPLLTTVAQAQAAANTRLQTLRRTTSRTFEVEMVPHPAVQTGDRFTLVTDAYGTFDAVVESLRLPLLADGGSEALTVRKLT